MASETANLHLPLTGVSETDKGMLFSTWRQLINGEGSNSAMNIIDGKFGDVDKAIDDIPYQQLLVVTDLPTTGNTKYIYLLKNGNKYDKYWWIKDETNQWKWDVFGGSSTEIVSQLPTTGDSDVDYILLTETECLYYKWIGGAWMRVGPSDIVSHVEYDGTTSELVVTENGITNRYTIQGGGSTGSSISISDVVRPTAVRNGEDANFSFKAVSSDDTNINVIWFVNGTQVAITTGASGATHQLNAGEYLLESSTNTVRAEMQSEGGASLIRSWQVTTSAFSISWGSSIDDVMLYTENENIFVVIDVAAQARSANTVTVSVGENSKSRSFTGSGNLTIELESSWFETGVNTVTASMVSDDSGDSADDIHFVAIWGYGATNPIVAFAETSITGVQYDTIPIYYYVYDPQNETAEATIQVGDGEPQGLNVGREMQRYSYVPQAVGDVTITLSSGGYTATVSVHVNKNDYNISIVTGDSLRYNLDPNGHSNSDADRDSFAGLTLSENFDWVNGGFQQDGSGATAFVVKKGNRATLPRSLFADRDDNGKTIDVSFKVVNSEMYDAVAMQDLNNGKTIGIILKANEGELRLNNATGQVFRYCEENRIDLSILVESTVAQRVATVWLDGIPSKVEKYGAGMLIQSENSMVIGSDSCDVWVYGIRCYNSHFKERDMIQNYIASGSTTSEKIARYKENDIFDDNERITPATLHAAMPNLTIIEIAAERMTENKKDPVPADIKITDGANVLELPKADGAVFKVQGTSSVAYGRSALNMDLDFKATGKKYKLSENAIPVNYLNIKVNVASSENANNVCAVDWYNTFQPFIIEARKNNSSIRDVVEGKPCAVFFTNTGSSAVWISSQQVQPGETILYVMGDMCNSKKNTKVFGQDGEGEHYTKACIEVSGNDTEQQRFQATVPYNYDNEEWDTYAGLDEQGKAKYTVHFEWRMDPSSEDLEEVVNSWNATVAWVVSTIGDPAKFKREFANYFTVDSMLYHFLMIEFFAAYDNVSKNTFYSYDWDENARAYRWNIKEAYDWDTIIACDNDGYPLGDYGIDYGDVANGRSYFNAVTNTIWTNIKAAYQSELSAMYISLRSQGAWNSSDIVSKWDNYQARRPHAAMVKDAYIKYIMPYKTDGVVIGTSTYSYDDNYLGRMQGSKTYQRKQFFTYQTDYMDGKYGYYSKTNSMQFRTNGDAGTKDFTVKAYAKTYVTMIVDNNVAGIRKVEAGGTTQFTDVSVGSNTTLYVTPDRLVQYVRPLNETQNSTFAASGAAKLMEVVLGGETENTSWASGTSIDIRSAILKELDIKNLTNFTSSLSLRPNVELQKLDTRGTNAGIITMPQYAPLTSIQLNACTGIEARNLKKVEQFSMASGQNLVYVWTEGCNSVINDAIPGYLLQAFTSGSQATRSARLIDVDWALDDTSLLNYLLTARAIDATGREGSAPCVLTGSVTVPSIKSRELAQYEAAWPGVVKSSTPPITQYAVQFLNDDGQPILDKSGNAYIQYVDSGESAYDPIEAGEVDVPTKASDAHYTYTFSDWDNLPVGVISNMTVRATYSKTVRTYTVTWYDGVGNGHGSFLERLTDVEYGSCVKPTNEYPTFTGYEGNNLYYVFNGWDSSTGYITDDTIVHATWIIGNLHPATGEHELSGLNWAEISAAAKNWDKVSEDAQKLGTEYWQPKEHTDFTLGRDFNFLNVESRTLIDTPTYFDGTAPIVFNGSSDDRPLIQLFTSDAPNFTIAIDYEFTSDSGVLLSCFNDDGNEGVELRRTGNYTNVLWGDSNLNVGFKYQRAILTLRHNKENPNVIYVGYDGNTSENVYPVSTNNPSSNAAETARARTRATETDAPLTLGGVGFVDGTDITSVRGTGWVHWCKIWFEDIGMYNAKALAAFPRLQMRFNYTPIRYRKSLDSAEIVSASFLSEAPLPLVGVMNTTSTNVGGWDATARRQWLNGQFFDGLPIPLQSIILEARVRASAGNRSTDITNSMDKVYLPAYAEVFPGQTDATYLSEMDDGNHTVSYFAANQSAGLTANNVRAKIPGFIIPDDANYIVDTSDPTLYGGTYPVVSEKTIWINTSNSSIAYVYVDADYLTKHKHLGARVVTSTDNISAQGTDSAGNTGGKWIRSASWWLRSPNLGYTTGFWYVYTNGGLNYASASGTIGLVPAFSI